ncbi:hypothetical protein BC628DRAFT_303426 [Trametes gibbosa]|nr:hypothetical protein BC628DRAFT_303426 [Trametes gibbosa]
MWGREHVWPASVACSSSSTRFESNPGGHCVRVRVRVRGPSSATRSRRPFLTARSLLRPSPSPSPSQSPPPPSPYIYTYIPCPPSSPPSPSPSPALCSPVMSLCVPPRMPSPQFVPAPLPPPPFPRRVSSRSRLHLPATPDEPPIPPRLVGSPLLEKLTHKPSTMSPKVHQHLWFDGDEFGTRTSTPPHYDSPLPSSASSSPFSSPRAASSSARRSHRRSPSVAYNRRARSHSPPPPPLASAAPPPVPPIPSSAFDTPGTKRPVLRTPPATPLRARTAQITIPDLITSTGPASALPYTRAPSTISPRRRGSGCESH